MMILKVQDLSILKDDTSIIQNLSFSVNGGQVLGVMGSSGVGKTLVMTSLIGLVDSLVVRGEVSLCGQILPINQPNDERWQLVRGQRIAYIFQDPKHTLNPTHTIKRIFTHILTKLKCPKSHHKAIMVDLLSQVGLSEPQRFLSRYPYELSGGEAQCVAIALAFAFNPTLIIADEPTSSLDDEHKQGVLDLFSKFTKDGKHAVIIVSHDDDIKAVCDDVLYLQSHKKTDYGTPTPMPSHAPIVLSVKDLSVAYRQGWFGQAFILKNINLTIHKSQIIGLSGVSGAGKTTFAKAIARLDDRLIATGQVWVSDGVKSWDMLALTGKELRRHHRQIMLMNQDVSASLNPDLTIKDSLDEAVCQNSPSVDKLLTTLRLDKSVLERYPHELSGGQKSRICLMRVLLATPSVIILDEPTAMLDTSNTLKLLNLLRHISTEFGTAMLIISHDKAVLRAVCHDVVDLAK